MHATEYAAPAGARVSLPRIPRTYVLGYDMSPFGLDFWWEGAPSQTEPSEQEPLLDIPTAKVTWRLLAPHTGSVYAHGYGSFGYGAGEWE